MGGTERSVEAVRREADAEELQGVAGGIGQGVVESPELLALLVEEAVPPVSLQGAEQQVGRRPFRRGPPRAKTRPPAPSPPQARAPPPPPHALPTPPPGIQK